MSFTSNQTTFEHFFEVFKSPAACRKDFFDKLGTAVLEKRGGVNLGMSDAYVNVIGGLQLDEPAADLALVLAAASSFRDKPIDPATAAIGEVGLTGEIRAVTGLQQRLSEASRTGFKTCIIPLHGTGNLTAPDGMELLRVRNIREAIELVLS